MFRTYRASPPGGTRGHPRVAFLPPVNSPNEDDAARTRSGVHVLTASSDQSSATNPALPVNLGGLSCVEESGTRFRRGLAGLAEPLPAEDARLGRRGLGLSRADHHPIGAPAAEARAPSSTCVSGGSASRKLVAGNAR